MSEPRKYSSERYYRHYSRDDNDLKDSDSYSVLCFICNEFNDNPALCDACEQYVHEGCGDSTNYGKKFFFCKVCQQ